MADGKSFSSVHEEIEHWKAATSRYKQKLEELQAEYEEFQTSSQDLEAELEAELNQYRSKVNELTVANQKLESELLALRKKYDDQFKCDYRRISELETKVKQGEGHTQVLQKYIRELEQTNDDLERAKRAAVVSLEDFEARLNQAIERNAFLESELDEKEDLAICVQRLKDETRDLKQEIAVQEIKEQSINDDTSDKHNVNTSGNTSVNQSLRSINATVNQLVNDKSIVSGSKVASLKGTRTSCIASPSSFTQASRVSALNLVGDMLRRVSALECKLSASRTLSYPVTGDSQTYNHVMNTTHYRSGMVGARV